MRPKAATNRLAAAAALALALAASAATSANATTPPQRFFSALAGAVSCELDDGGGLAVQAYCQTITKPRSATLSANGKVTLCSGVRCIGNPPDNEKSLAAGHRASLGPFTCTVSSSMVDCTVQGDRGFSISRTGVKKI
jgi:hypothetical protein